MTLLVDVKLMLRIFIRLENFVRQQLSTIAVSKQTKSINL